MKLLISTVLSVAALVGAATAQVWPTPNPIFDAADHSKLVETVPNGKKMQVEFSGQKLIVVHAYGSVEAAGYAYGQLLSTEILEFLDVAMRKYMPEKIKAMLDKFGKEVPSWLKLLIEDGAKDYGWDVMILMCEYVLKDQLHYIEKAFYHPVEEYKAIGRGVCANKSCDETKVATLIAAFNEYPDLIKMQCSMLGAWGKATQDGGLVQMRTLDFGGGPFPQYAVLAVFHPEIGNTFASLAFPGFMGVITGFSTKVALSEKLFLISGASGPQPGTLEGEAVTIVSREVLQFANSTQQAIAIMQKRSRTYAVSSFVCLLSCRCLLLLLQCNLYALVCF